ITAPQIHASAVKNPKMLGGPFIDYDGKRVDEIAALMKRTLAERSYLGTLSKALAEMDRTLQAKAKGESVHCLYPLVPEPLRGYGCAVTLLRPRLHSARNAVRQHAVRSGVELHRSVSDFPLHL